MLQIDPSDEAAFCSSRENKVRWGLEEKGYLNSQKAVVAHIHRVENSMQEVDKTQFGTAEGSLNQCRRGAAVRDNTGKDIGWCPRWLWPES